MQTRSMLIRSIDAYLSRTGMTPRHFGLKAVGDHKFVPRLKAGKGITLTVIEKVERFMAEHPDGVREDAA